MGMIGLRADHHRSQPVVRVKLIRFEGGVASDSKSFITSMCISSCMDQKSRIALVGKRESRTE